MIEDFVNGPWFDIGIAGAHWMLGGVGTCSDGGIAPVGVETGVYPDLTSAKSIRWGCDPLMVVWCVYWVSVEPCTCGASMNTGPSCGASLDFDPSVGCAIMLPTDEWFESPCLYELVDWVIKSS